MSMSVDPQASDDRYVEIFLTPLRKCVDYRPAFGQSQEDGFSLTQFMTLYGGDPLYHWIGLDSELMYAAHKAGGGMTSVYRQLGVGCERFFRAIAMDSLNLSLPEVVWSYQLVSDQGRTQTLSLDARIAARDIKDVAARERVLDWIERSSVSLGVNLDAINFQGAVFEVRQGYKSADSKRQNADLRSGGRAHTEGYLPVIMLFSRQVNRTVERRYRGAGLLVLAGDTTGPDTESTYQFCKNVVGFDAAAFFQRNASRLRGEVEAILKGLLSPQ
ncbi:MAG: hypothetical protein V9F06_07095 [Thermomicrobiales bacterium]